MSETELNTPRKIKEITISNKKSITSGNKKYANEINIIPIKITLTPKIKQNLLKSFNSTTKNRLYQKDNNDEINKKLSIKSKKIIMTPKVESNYSNCSSSLTSPSVIIKNFNYNNVYNINIDKEKDKKTPMKIYKNYTYNKPKTTSNINLKNDMTFNNSIISDNKFNKDKEKKEYYSRINSEKNILKSRKNLVNNNIINNNEIKFIDFSKKNQIKTLYYNIKDNNKNIYNRDIKRTLSNMTIKSAEIKLDNNYYLPFNPNDLYLLFEKINFIIISLSKNKGKDIYINCQDFFIFYNKSSLKRVFPSFFNENYKLILDSSINLCLFSLIIIYNLSSENLMTYNIINIIERILLYCKINFALFIIQIQIKYKINLGNIFQKYLISKNITNITKEKDLINIIYQNSKTMTNDIKLIMNYYKTVNAMLYNNMVEKFNNISIQKEDDYINYFFDSISKQDIQTINKICETSRNNNIKSDNLNNNSYINVNVFSPKRKNAFENLSIKKDDINNYKIITKKLVKRQKKEILKNRIEIPYIKTPPMKKYTLILDLDKTISYINNITGEIKLRNGLFSFLSGIKPFYEIITFSLEPKNTCDSVINMIEQDKKYFDFKFYKEHSVLYENNLVKDLSLIGRDISKTIIVDDEEVCFKLNKENGIKIAPFNGENNNDNKLFELKKLLKEIYVANYDDLRIALKNYKLDIINKITLN